MSTEQVPFTSYTPKVAIVTGAAQGIGYAIALRLADDGFDIAVNDIPAKQDQINSVLEEIHKKGRRAISVAGDVTVESDVISIVEKTVKELEGVDVMVANAGGTALNPFLETSVEYFDKVYALNARSVFMCFKYATAQMVKQGRGGRLIAASSLAGKQGTPLMTPYCASKFAVRGITQCAAAEFRKYGITANTYAPGIIRTPAYLASDVAGRIPEAEIGAPENIASIASYLAKPESYFVNGQSITVDGGFSRFD